MKRTTIFVALLAVVACSRGPEVRMLDRSSLPRDLYDPRQVTRAPRMVHVRAFFIRTEPQSDPSKPARFLTPVRLGGVDRSVRTPLSEVEATARVLLVGPTPEQRAAGFASVIEEGTELIGISVTDGVADVNLSAEFEAVTSQLGQLMRLAQVVWTLTELPEVEAVRFRIHGVPQPVIDQNGVAHERVGQGRYSRFAPRETDEGDVVSGAVAPVVTSAP